ncbi:hypothetical protein WN944_003002 [Citrus x changshan-huyou]|uniref:Uncharacterized protein n=1 Tax=Citrus x changshan-huyou TaxID=2935761 RepID=A0AAP0MMQ6_9ROSI
MSGANTPDFPLALLLLLQHPIPMEGEKLRFNGQYLQDGDAPSHPAMKRDSQSPIQSLKSSSLPTVCTKARRERERER